MKKSVYFLVLLAFVQIVTAQQKSPPGWQVNPNLYQYNATVTAKVLYNNGNIPAGTVILGAFAGSEVRGTATPLTFGGEKYFFLTVYTNNPTENISFKVYFGSIDSVLLATGQLSIVANGVYGTLSDPYLISTFFQFNHTPVVSGIPDQSVELGNSFSSINLGSYLTEPDNDPVTWTYRNNSNVVVNITGSTAAVSYSGQWTGSDTVIFRATESIPSALYDEDTVVFTVSRVDHAPDFNSLPGQTIGNNAQFAGINLRSFVNETDGDSLAWSSAYILTGSNDPTPSWSVNPALYNASMTMTAAVNFPGGTVNGNNNLLAAFSGGQIRGVASGINFAGRQLFFLTIYSNTVGDSISFRYYDATAMKNVGVLQKTVFVTNASLGTPSVPYTVDAGNIITSITAQGSVLLKRTDAAWHGSERIRFTVRDIGTPNTFQDTISAVFSVLNDNTPVISGIPNQAVVAPQSFSNISLNNYISEYDGNGTVISVLNNNHIQISIGAGNIASVSVTPSGWSGSENVIFRVTDNTANALYSEDTVTFAMRATDNAPVINTIPTQAVVTGGVFQALNIRSYITEIDGDSVSISFQVKQAPPNASAPVWQINASQFQQSMNITAEVTSAGIKPTGSQHQLGAFVGGVLRGVATPIQFGSKWLYFLTVYANTAGEKVSFKFFDASMQKIYPVQGTITFSSNAIIGTPSAPNQMNAGNILFSTTGNQSIAAVIVDSTWNGTETLTIIARDAQTINQYSDTTEVVFQVGNIPELHLTALIEAMYRLTADTMYADTVTVLLKSSTGDYATKDSVRVKLNNHGQGTYSFTKAQQNTDYYIVVLYRNAIETWSAEPIRFTGGILNYDFTSAQSKAYGNNLVQVGTKWCILSGEVTGNYWVEIDDVMESYNNYLTDPNDGISRRCDFDANGYVEIEDVILSYNRYLQGGMSINPLNIEQKERLKAARPRIAFIDKLLLELTGTSVEIPNERLKPTAYNLGQNYPNPFNPSTAINYALPQESDVEISIYNISGQKIRSLVSGNKQAGYYTAVWDGRNDFSEVVSSGIYIYRIQAGNFRATKKLTFLK